MRSPVITKMTKELFSNALKEYMKKKPINKITVNELAQSCGFSRRTFYRYFKDIYDLLEWTYQIEIKEKIDGYIDFEHWQEGLLDVFCYFYSNKEISTSIIKYSKRKYLEKFLNTLFKDSIRDVIQKEKHYDILSEDKKEFLINFYTITFTGILIDWIENDMKENPEEIINNIREILDGSILRLVKIPK
ncbi:MAG: TetR/AcrR family transcriptional regulator [Sarcina sp.]